MIKPKFLTFFICFIIFKASALEKPPSKSPSKKIKRCQITVNQLLKTGEKTNNIFWPGLKSKIACEKASKVNQINFNPKMIEKVEVSYKWDEK